MKIARRVVAVLMVFSILLTMSVPAFAFGPNESRSVENFFVDAQLLKGDGTGYGLENTASRLEGIIILIRLMGKEAEAQSMNGMPCQFADVPEWARGYVNYAYSEGLSKGTSETRFGVSEKMTVYQYNTLMLRVMGYNDSQGDFYWEDSVDKAKELSILPRDMARTYLNNDFVFTKGDLMDTSFCYLESEYKDLDQTLLDTLMETGVVTDELAKRYGLGIESWNSLSTNLGSNEYFNFDLDDEVLSISGKSEDEDKEWLLVQIINKATGAKKTEKVDKRDGDGTHDFPISIASLPNGEYYIDLYANNEKYNTYHGFINSGIIMKISGNEAFFAPSPVYGANLRIYNGNRVETEDEEISLVTRADKDVHEQIKALADEITQECTSDYEKVQAVHDWVAGYLYYDEDFAAGEKKLSNITSKDILEERFAVCSGYSILTKDLLAAAGIPCKIILGYGLGESEADDWAEVDLKRLEPNHAWNEAYVDGRWIILDTTWDTTNTYEDGVFTKGDGISRRYFDSALKYFSNTHKAMEW